VKDWRANVHPRLVAKVEAILSEMASEKVQMPMRVVSGYRSPLEQLWLYAQGRTRPGPRVTNLRLGMHNLGLAVDCAFVLPNGRVTWDKPDRWWREYGARAKRRGLHWGGDWNRFVDRPHVQIVSVSEQDEAIAAWRKHRNLAMVWQAVLREEA
jgi:peptidoglycan LD-endopeptidase CwlK